MQIGGGRGRGALRRGRGQAWLLLPGGAWLAFFFILPLLGILAMSVMRPHPGGGVEPVGEAGLTLETWKSLGEPLYARVLLRSLGYAAASTALCFAGGYPIALLLARLSGRARNIVLVLLIIPLWMSFLLKAYAWRHLLGDEGLLNRALLALALVDEPVRILYTPASVLIGLVASYLPFMVLPIFVSLERQDPRLVWAAMDLGATRFHAFVHVTTRLALPGITAGAVLVFVPTFGEFVIPDVLGGGQVYGLGNLVKDQYLGATPHWPLGAALAACAILTTMAAVAISLKARGLAGAPAMPAEKDERGGV
jgi:spermidine/putrescine transport system permease protein